ncbi:MAG TPA: alpha-glucuronidase family glycosyl hydrolase [Bacillota bacterium]|nr:alpha-glucuronidase family glycosyl hydrolase [Bacillota bacterium]
MDYRKITNPDFIRKIEHWFRKLVVVETNPVLENAVTEIRRGIDGMLRITPTVSDSLVHPATLIGTVEGFPLLGALLSHAEKEQIREEGFALKTVTRPEGSYLVIAGKTAKGALYGAFHLLKLIALQTDLHELSIVENPKNPLRLIEHWDNLDGKIERGYAGGSIFYRENQISGDFGRIKDYARLLSSIGINGIVINNVNVHEFETRLITREYLPQVTRLASLFRDYGIRIFLSINFASPIRIGQLDTADPLDPGVRKWWWEKVAEIYDLIPDFGGFLVKADSEFNPGPYQYGRSHADGANMLGDALELYGGLVIWRCFVYNCLQDWRDRITDRARAAYDNFKPLDGLFKDNVVLQVKNGPMDFQVREPVSSLLGGMEKTNETIELQITQEYTGQQRHLCYLVPLWKEVLDFDTQARGQGAPVKKVVDGSLFGWKNCGFAAVSNVGDDPNWTGHHLAQANLYGFGRLAWNPDLTAAGIAAEWIHQSFSSEEMVVATISEMLLDSWRIYESYTAPLGIGWMVNPGHHYGPNVDGYEYSKWGTYHRADCDGIGIDRTMKTGTGYVSQYYPPVAARYDSLETCPDELLLFFHHVSYTHRLKSGETVIQYIYNTHFEGVEEAARLKEKWLKLKGKIDEQRFEQVLKRLEEQVEHAKEWRDQINTYFYRKTGIPDEKGRKIH